MLHIAGHWAMQSALGQDKPRRVHQHTCSISCCRYQDCERTKDIPTSCLRTNVYLLTKSRLTPTDIRTPFR